MKKNNYEIISQDDSSSTPRLTTIDPLTQSIKGIPDKIYSEETDLIFDFLVWIFHFYTFQDSMIEFAANYLCKISKFMFSLSSTEISKLEQELNGKYNSKDIKEFINILNKKTSEYSGNSFINYLSHSLKLTFLTNSL